MKERLVVYAPEARDDLLDIFDLVARAAGPDIALAYSERIEEFCQRMFIGSERGHLRNDIRPGLRVIGMERRVTIAFVVEPERVVVLRILYAGQSLERAF